jgi:hypothetical protein
LSVLHSQSAGDFQTFPVTSGLCNIITNLLGGLQWNGSTTFGIYRMILSLYCSSFSLLIHTRPRGPTLGAREEAAPTSPPIHLT